MYTVKSSADFILGIKALDERLKNIRLNSVEIDKATQSVKYNFICDTLVDGDLKDKIRAEAEKISAAAFKNVSISVSKIVSNFELINTEIYKYLQENFPSVSIFLKPTDILIADMGEVIKYTLRLTKDGAEYVAKCKVIDKITDNLEKKFCSDFVGDTDIKEAEETVDLMSEEVYQGELQRIEHRTIKVKEPLIIDDFTMGDTALYIEDFTSGDAVICGNITDIVEKETKNGKPFFIIHLDDRTGTTSGVYFTKKATYHKIKELKTGDAIIARASIGEYAGRRSTTFDKINRCVFPEDFVKKDRFKKSAPKEYRLIFPESATTVKANSVFDEEIKLPQEILDNEYVVFDLETTGVDVMNNGITEIGAVKIKGGKIVEEWTTLVKPDYPITDEIIKLTGITPELVKDSPKISQVLPDFMKFIDGAILVAHNAEFDTKFIKRFAAAEEYDIKNKVLDTMIIARTAVPTIKRFDLHTLAEHFKIVFHHHRALADAYATAEIFIEMNRIK